MKQQNSRSLRGWGWCLPEKWRLDDLPCRNWDISGIHFGNPNPGAQVSAQPSRSSNTDGTRWISPHRKFIQSGIFPITCLLGKQENPMGNAGQEAGKAPLVSEMRGTNTSWAQNKIPPRAGVVWIPELGVNPPIPLSPAEPQLQIPSVPWELGRVLWI